MSQIRLLLTTVLTLVSGIASAQESRLPIIDMHLHAVSADSQGPPPIGLCSPLRGIPASDSNAPYSDRWIALLKNPPCDDAVWSPESNEDLQCESLALIEKHNIIGVTSGTAELVRSYKDAAPDRIIQGLLLGGPGAGSERSIAAMRALHDDGRLQVVGEVATQYAGISPDDERLEPLWALAEELDLPVGIHIGTGPPGVIYIDSPNYRARLHSALTLEEVLVRHPNLRVYIMHAGWPMIDDLLAVLWAHPQVYVDVAVIDWAVPTEEFYQFLRRIVASGFGDRIMYGSDQMVWPGMIERSIRVISDAPFLDEEQKRDVLYNNAARFLRLSKDEIARHHEM